MIQIGPTQQGEGAVSTKANHQAGLWPLWRAEKFIFTGCPNCTRCDSLVGWGLGGSPFAGLVQRYLPSSVIKLFVSVSIFNEHFPCSLYSEPCSLSQTCREIISLGKVKFVLNSRFQQNTVYTVSIYYKYLVGNTKFYRGTTSLNSCKEA